MKPLNLKAIPENDTQPPSIEVTDHKGKLMAKIWADQRITVNEPHDFYLEEVDHFTLIAREFYLFYNNIQSKLTWEETTHEPQLAAPLLK